MNTIFFCVTSEAIQQWFPRVTEVTTQFNDSLLVSPGLTELILGLSVCGSDE